MEFLNLLLKYFRELDSLYSIGTCLVIVIISICFLLVAGILIPNSDIKSRINAIFLQDTLLLYKQSMVLKAQCKHSTRQGYPKQINSLWGQWARQNDLCGRTSEQYYKKILKTVLKESQGNTLSRSLLIHTSISAIEKRDRGFQI